MTEAEVKEALIQCFSSKKGCCLTTQDGEVEIRANTMSIFGPTVIGISVEDEVVNIPPQHITNVEVR